MEINTLNIVAAIILCISYIIAIVLSHQRMNYGKEMRNAISTVSQDVPDFDFWIPGWKEKKIYSKFIQLGLHKKYTQLYHKYRLVKKIEILASLIFLISFFLSIPVFEVVIGFLKNLLKR